MIRELPRQRKQFDAVASDIKNSPAECFVDFVVVK